MALAILSLTGLSTLNVKIFEGSIALGQTAAEDSREAESSATVPVQKVSQQSLNTKQQSVAETTLNEGNRLYTQGTVESLKAAITKFEEASRLYSTAGNHQSEAICFLAIGRVYDLLEERQKALFYYNQSLDLFGN
jgi:tetratricopeptide (TPR) repeat protein